MKEILLIAPYQQMYESALRIIKDEKYGNIGVVKGNRQEGLVQALNAVEQNAHVVISRGCTYQLIKQANIGIPLVEIRLSSSDLIDSLSAAIEKDRPIAIVGHSNLVNKRDETMLKKIKTELTIVNITENDDVKEVVSSCAAQGFSMFIGDTIVKEICDMAGYECYLHQSSDASIKVALDEALQIYAALQQEQELSRRLRTVIDFVNDGIIATDKDNKVILFNAIAQHLLGIKQKEILGEPIEALSMLPFACEVKKNGKIIDQTFTVSNRLLSCSSIPVSMEAFSFGSIIIIRDIQKIQDWEQKLRIASLEKGFVAKHNFSSIVHKSAEIAHCISIAKKFSQYTASVLIEGESGVGKELFAQSIHNDGIRRKEPFVAVNCAAIPKTLIESELFGYVEGAFTGSRKGGKAGYFELAHRGTLFLDEISELPLDVQAQLLRVIQEKEVMRIGDSKIMPIDVRLICATNKNLVEMEHKSLFRKDLLFRINTLALYIPPLSGRREDIELLANYFLRDLCKTYNKNIQGFSAHASAWLCNYHYEGNIRELRNIIERAVIVCDGEVICLGHFQDGRREASPLAKVKAAHDTAATETITLGDIEKNHISRILADNNRSMTKASAALGISRTTLWRKIQDLGI